MPAYLSKRYIIARGINLWSLEGFSISIHALLLMTRKWARSGSLLFIFLCGIWPCRNECGYRFLRYVTVCDTSNQSFIGSFASLRMLTACLMIFWKPFSVYPAWLWVWATVVWNLMLSVSYMFCILFEMNSPSLSECMILTTTVSLSLY